MIRADSSDRDNVAKNERSTVNKMDARGVEEHMKEVTLALHAISDVAGVIKWDILKFYAKLGCLKN